MEIAFALDASALAPKASQARCKVDLRRIDDLRYWIFGACARRLLRRRLRALNRITVAALIALLIWYFFLGIIYINPQSNFRSLQRTELLINWQKNLAKRAFDTEITEKVEANLG